MHPALDAKSESNIDLIILNDIASDLGEDVYGLSCEVFDDKRFALWPGSLDGKHHCYKGGLARHVREVVSLCLKNAEYIAPDVDKIELFLAALYHDTGKMFDYSLKTVRQKQPSDFGEIQYVSTEWEGTPHKRQIHHISRSGIIWTRAVEKFPALDAKYHDSVLHAILAHHGQREWGSPVAPYTKAAWLLHTCDQMSARLDDCQKVDYLKAHKD